MKVPSFTEPNCIVLVSGYFNPLHAGHIQMINEASTIATKQKGELWVIVNNDKQQQLKKNKIIMTLEDRITVVKAIKGVDWVVPAIDEDKTICKSLKMVRLSNRDSKLIFCNGGDRNSVSDIPETEICKTYNIQTRFGIGGSSKHDSSSRINQELGREAVSNKEVDIGDCVDVSVQPMIYSGQHITPWKPLCSAKQPKPNKDSYINTEGSTSWCVSNAKP